MSYVLGITGGIATGKSTAVAFFRKRGIPIVDGDVVARLVVEPNQPGLNALTAALGTGILQSDGRMDRSAVGELLFHDPVKRAAVNEILDPYIRQEILRQLAAAKKTAPLVIMDIPLLYEAGYDQYADEVAVVYIPETLQAKRLMKRDNIGQASAEAKIASQMPIEAKRRLADTVFDNQQTKAELDLQLCHWLKRHQQI